MRTGKRDIDEAKATEDTTTNKHLLKDINKECLLRVLGQCLGQAVLSWDEIISVKCSWVWALLVVAKVGEGTTFIFVLSCGLCFVISSKCAPSLILVLHLLAKI